VASPFAAVRWRGAVAWSAAAAVVLGSPIIGDLRLALLRAFPRDYVAIISGGVALCGAIVLLACWRAIRSDRPRRIGMLGLAAVLAAVSFAAVRSGNPNVDAVEAFHFVEYSGLALLFFPFGQAGARWEAYVEAALATTVVAVADEWFQWFVPVRAGEWHDVLVDLLATACGLLLCRALDTRESFRRRGCADPPSGRSSGSLAPPSGRSSGSLAPPRGRSSGSLDPPHRTGTRLGVRAAAVILLVGAFFATIHLGTEISDPEIGVFRSRFSAARLRELGIERRRQWGGRPPPVAGRYGREDQYEAEALWHVRRRNFGLDPDRKGDPIELDIAWHENLILERHFGAVLAAASTGGAPGHRLSPEQLADVEARRAHAYALFESDAEAMPIHAWAPAVFWTVVAGVAGAAFGAGVLLDRARRSA
jgi:VanZ family protein